MPLERFPCFVKSGLTPGEKELLQAKLERIVQASPELSLKEAARKAAKEFMDEAVKELNEVHTQIGTPGFERPLEIGITPAVSATGEAKAGEHPDVTEIRGLMKQASDLEGQGKFDEANKLHDQILDKGSAFLAKSFKDIKGARVNLEYTKGNYGNSNEPTFKMTIDAVGKAREKALAALARFGQHFGQETIHASEVIDRLPKGAEYGKLNPDGSVYEPNIDLRFKKPLSDAEFHDLSQAIQKTGLAGATLHPDKKGLTLYNVSKFTHHGEFAEQYRKAAEILNARGITPSVKEGVRRLWIYGNESGGATRTYESLLPEGKIAGKYVPEETAVKSSDNGIREPSAGTVGAHANGDESTGRSGESSGVGSGQQGKEPPGEGGGGTPQEEGAGQTEDQEFGIRQTTLQKIAERLGLKPPKPGEVLPPKEQIARGRRLLAAGADPDDIRKTLAAEGTPSADQISVARAHYENLTNEANAAFKKGGKDPNNPEFKTAQAKMQEWQDNVIKKAAPAASASLAAFQMVNNLSDGSYSSMASEFQNKKNRAPNAQESAKIIELSNKVQEQKTALDQANKKLQEIINKGGVEKESATKYSEKAKKVADRFRKFAKTKEFIFKDKDGNEYNVTKMGGPSWNELVELGAKAIEKTGQVIDGVRAVIDHLKDVDWYKKLSDDDKARFSDELTKQYENGVEETPAMKNIRRLEGQLEKIRRGEVNQPEKRELTPEEQALHAQIQEEKDKLGLSKGRLYETLPMQHVRTGEMGEGHAVEMQDYGDLTTRFTGKKDGKFSPKDARNVWDYAKKEYLDKGSDFDNMISNVGKDLGLTPKQVRQVITTPKGAEQQMMNAYKQQYKYRQVLQAANNWLLKEQDPALLAAFKALPSIMFSWTVFGHGTVGGITHAALNIFSPSAWKSYWPNFAKQFKFFWSSAKHEMAMRDLENSPNFWIARRAGLANDPGLHFDDYQLLNEMAAHLGKAGNKMGEFVENMSKAGNRGFDALKVMRQDMFDMYYKKLSNEQQGDIELLKEIATFVNHATGTSNVQMPKITSSLIFAPKLEVSRWARLAELPRASVTGLKMAWNATPWGHTEISPAEIMRTKMAVRKNIEIIGMYATALAANQGLLMAFGSKQKINWSDPYEEDWLKFKFGGKEFDATSGIRTTLHDIWKLAVQGARDINSKGKPISQSDAENSFYKTFGKYIRSKASPFGGSAWDLISRADYLGNTLPFNNRKPSRFAHHLTWGEWATATQLPIPLAEIGKDMFEQLREEEMDRSLALKITDALIKGAVSGGLGMRVGEDIRMKRDAEDNAPKKAASAFDFPATGEVKQKSKKSEFDFPATGK